MIVTNEEEISCELNPVIGIVSPIPTLSPTEEPQSIKDIIKDLVNNPLDVPNSIYLSKEIIDILTDSRSLA